jgi:hypothetical protein
MDDLAEILRGEEGPPILVECEADLTFTNLSDVEIPAGTAIFMNGAPAAEEQLVVTVFRKGDKRAVAHPMPSSKVAAMLADRQPPPNAR